MSGPLSDLTIILILMCAKIIFMRVIFSEMPRLQELKRKQYLVFLTIDGKGVYRGGARG